MIFLYLISIAAANVTTAACAPVTVLGLIIPAGSAIAGLTFVLRDMMQEKHGAYTTMRVIFFATGISGGLSVGLGDGAYVAVASLVAFTVSEFMDTFVYTMLRASFFRRAVMSGIIGGLIDSGVFVILGLSPIGAGMLTWAQVPLAILGQSVVKAALQPFGAAVYLEIVKKRRKRRQSHDSQT